MARDWRDGFAEFWGQGSEDVAPGRKLKPGGNGQVKTDLWDTIWGRSQSEMNEAYQTDKADKLESKYKNQLNALEPGSYVRGSDEGTYLSQLKRLTRKDDNEAFDSSPQGRQLEQQNTRLDNADNRAVKAQEDSTEIARETLGVTRENNANQMQLANNQMEMARLDNKFDRETASADRALTLQLGQMNADLQDKRLAYDRETRSMDKRDRMIAQLMSGLGSLGGAFSL